MAIDRNHLMNFNIPEVRQSYGPRDVAQYALSIGMGQDPMDMPQLSYVGGLQDDIRVMPAIANVLGHPGFWLSDPATGVDALRLVHGEQGMTVHAPIPVAATIRAKTRVTGLIDKGEGRGALLYSEKEIFDDATGAHLATCRGTTFLRGDGGFGGPSDTAKPVHQLPETAPDHVFETSTRPEQALIYRWNGDTNPLHLDPRVAEGAGFERPILHGLCTFGCAAHALLATLCDYDAARFGAMDARFTAHVFPGETLRTEVWKDGSFRTCAVERDKVVIGNGKFQYSEA
ncbi:MaoC like domain protein (plasmid) [Pseudosulfitobacter pseudonitzschiae]|jgi:acyl dehydratase|uniref:MaoC like domain protein n=1 Tax=Pseudosulfitobacter pseudonitzschiae TaxID=1402135 RepID=A0A221K8I2_9RHOB|nr:MULTISPECIES: MaoC/PaaZ C-terminal domain-containing protein [Roseobacteraceae]ASM75312.1 MaoC like domain protein [Pseudosulfitobacter pseudonitzschiae]|tara:strand:- start:19821 stop:20681 length:861 start_codon:yes stop_codon:yes gene_type:complete